MDTKHLKPMGGGVRKGIQLGFLNSSQQQYSYDNNIHVITWRA